MNTEIKVLIVDDSKVSRDLLGYILGKDPSINIIGYAENGLEALNFIQKQRPDVIITDIEMPIMNGFQLTKEIMRINPIPIIVVSGAYNQSEVATTFQALDAGALAIIEKPKGLGDAQCLDTARFVTETIKTLAEVKIKERIDEHTSQTGRKKEGSASAPASPYIKSEDVNSTPHKIEAIAIGASIGGPKAIRAILSQLPPKFPIPIFVSQHITGGFIDGFINWLNNSTTFHVKLAQNGEQVRPGHVYVCPDSTHMTLTPSRTICLKPATDDGGAPTNISKLFDSMARTYGPHAIGVLLTGIGNDGAKELLLMKERGAYTVAQDETTCVKFDLPQAAIKLGATKAIEPLTMIPNLIEKLVDHHV